MARRRPAFRLFVAALFCFTCSGWAQSAAQEAPGIWHAGRWIGYTPAHVEYANRNRAPGGARFQAAPTAGPVDHLAGTGPQDAQPAEQGTSPDESEIVPTSFQQAMPAETGVLALEGGCESCGGVDGCGVPDCTGETCCGTPCCPSPCCPSSWLYGRAEYLLWWTSGMDLPPLVTTSPPGTLHGQAGVLGQPGTTVLFGGDRLKVGSQSGGRVRLGMWLDPGGCRALEASYMVLGQSSEQFEQSSDGDPTIARPFFDVLQAEQDALLIAFDGVDNLQNVYLRGGSLLVRGKTRLQGAELLFRRPLFQQCERRLHLLLGYQFNRLDDELRIEQQFTVQQDPIVIAGTEVELFDLFDTANSFHGGQLGLVFKERFCGMSMELSMKLGLGNTHSRVLIDGETTTTLRGVSSDSLGGLLALESNIGKYERDHFAMIPELGITLGYDVTCNMRATFGYTFLYWSKVARPGDQIDLDVNTTQFGGNLVGEPRPEFNWVTTDFWAQGLRFGLEWNF